MQIPSTSVIKLRCTPPLVCARSGYLHTLCSDVTQRRGFHHYISDCRLTLLDRVFTQTGKTALPSRRFLQISYPQFHNSASHAIRFHAESGSGHLMMLELIFIGRSYAASSSVSFCRLQSSVQWDSQTVCPTTPSGSQ